MLTMYSTSWCGYCHRLKSQLDREGIAYDVVDIEQEPAAADFVAAMGGEVNPKFGWTDVARFTALGIPAVNYGPGDPVKAHADEQRVAVDQIASCEAGLRTWLLGG